MRGYEDLIEYIASAARAVIDEKGRAVFAIDGRCASGKTTAAQEISKSLPCTVFHADDFFLRPEQRTPERYAIPGGNFDRERFLNEVLLPAVSGETVNYRPFDCKSMKILEPQIIHPEKIIIVEGAYCCHPVLWDCYDKRIFFTVSPEDQISRIRKRNGDMVKTFIDRWIPMEERYFKEYNIEERCDKVFINK